MPRLYFLTFYFLILALSADTQGQEYFNIAISSTDTSALFQQMEAMTPVIKLHSDSAEKFYSEALMISKTVSFKKGITLAFLQLAKIQCYARNYKISNILLDSALTYLGNSEDSVRLMQAYKAKSYNYAYLNDYTKSLEYSMKAIRSAGPNTHLLGSVYLIIGSNLIVSHLDDSRTIERAIPYLDSAILFCKKTSEHECVVHAYTTRGRAYALLKQTMKAKKSFDNAMLWAKSKGLCQSLITAMGFTADFLNKQGLFEEALEIIKEVQRSQNECPDHIRTPYLLDGLAADAYLNLQQYSKAEKMLVSAREKHRQAKGSNNDLAYIIHRLGEVYYATGKYKEAYDLHLESHQLLDSIKSQQVQTSVNQLEIQYRTAEKDKKLALQALSLAKQQKALSERNTLIAVIIAGVLLAGLLLLWRYRHSKRKQQHKEEVSHLKGIIEGEEKERYRLAHELHDGINAQLAAIQAHLTAGASSFPANDPNIATARSLVKETAASIRHVAHNLAPHHLQAKGLVQMIQDHLRDVFTDSTTQTEVDAYGDFNSLDPELSLLLYRILQELAQNVKKYAEASRLTLLLYRSDGQIAITVEDNGKGFDPATLASPEVSSGIGLAGIRDRLKRYNGTMEINSAPEGTVVHIEVPD